MGAALKVFSRPDIIMRAMAGEPTAVVLVAIAGISVIAGAVKKK